MTEVRQCGNQTSERKAGEQGARDAELPLENPIGTLASELDVDEHQTADCQ